MDIEPITRNNACGSIFRPLLVSNIIIDLSNFTFCKHTWDRTREFFNSELLKFKKDLKNGETGKHFIEENKKA